MAAATRPLCLPHHAVGVAPGFRLEVVILASASGPRPASWARQPGSTVAWILVRRMAHVNGIAHQ